MASNRDNGILKIKNVSGSGYILEELADYNMANNEELDLLDTELAAHYGSFEDAKRATVGSNKLAQSIVAGDIEVTEQLPPVLKRRRG